jgi:hypothetical protein
MKKLIISFVLLTMAISGMNAQTRNSIFAELGGQGLLFTFNYDARFLKKESGPGYRVGVGYMKMDDNSTLTIPVSFNYLLGKKSKFLELGLGGTLANAKLFDSGSGLQVFGTMSFCYRYQPTDGGFSYRIGLSPVFGVQGGGFFFPYFGGISVGYSF